MSQAFEERLRALDERIDRELARGQSAPARPRDQAVIAAEIDEAARSLPGSDYGERLAAYFAAHPDAYAAYQRAPHATTPLPAAETPPPTLQQARRAFAEKPSGATIVAVVEAEARAVRVAEPQLSAAEVLNRVFKTNPDLYPRFAAAVSRA